MTDNELQILSDFEHLKGELHKWGSYVDSLLKEKVLPIMFQNGFIKIHPSYRLKNDKSYLFKVLYRKREYINPLLEIEDKVATRIVLLKSDEIQNAAELILKFGGWKAKITKGIRDGIEDQPKIFDYQSCHIVVWPDETYESQTNRELLTCEIQIRTLLQHAFAEMSHDSTYKGPYRNDHEILRHLAKSMALMESTDDYFCKVFDLMANEQREYTLLINELINLYKAFDETFSRSSLNFDLSDRIFELYFIQKVELSDLDMFTQKFNQELKRAIRPKNGLLFQQPIIILVAFYLFNHSSFLKEHWPLNKESLLKVFKSFNYSYESY